MLVLYLPSVQNPPGCEHTRKLTHVFTRLSLSCQYHSHRQFCQFGRRFYSGCWTDKTITDCIGDAQTAGTANDSRLCRCLQGVFLALLFSVSNQSAAENRAFSPTAFASTTSTSTRHQRRRRRSRTNTPACVNNCSNCSRAMSR